MLEARRERHIHIHTDRGACGGGGGALGRRLEGGDATKEEVAPALKASERVLFKDLEAIRRASQAAKLFAVLLGRWSPVHVLERLLP